jgi:hypothetical protein
MRKTALTYGSSLGANPRVGDLASAYLIERELGRRKLGSKSETGPLHQTVSISTTNANHAGQFIPQRESSHYTGYRPRFQGDHHFM